MKKKTTKKVAKAPAPANHRPTINAEAVDALIEQTIANLYALQMVWDKISLKEELSNDD
jgi:hypothetical protein